MASRSVYLGLLDIDLHGKLELRTYDKPLLPIDVARYLFSYGLVANNVVMQGSAPLKSTAVFGAYLMLSEAFQRNEKHERTEIYSFALSSDSENYLGYLVERLDFLKRDKNPNAEKFSYLVSDRKRQFLKIPVPYLLRQDT